jgi:hypothetical protein
MFTFPAQVPPPPPPATATAAQTIRDDVAEIDRIIAQAQVAGWRTPEVRSELGAIINYYQQIASLVEQTPCSEEQQRQVKEYGDEVVRLIEGAQVTGWNRPEVRSQLGSVRDYGRYIVALVDAPDTGTPTTPTPSPTLFVPPVANGGIFGRRKWATGRVPGQGCDVFVPVDSPLFAPADCVVEEVIPGQGISGGAELIIALPDRSWAWRWRHVQEPGVRVGQQVSRGSPLGYVRDDSLNMLGAIPPWAVAQAGRAFPSGWQHCDLSVNKGSDQFPPQGGSGGNYDAYTWLVENGYTGTVLERTPGPPDAGFSFEESVAMLTPQGRAVP